jgi:hypothetical protein
VHRLKNCIYLLLFLLELETKFHGGTESLEGSRPMLWIRICMLLGPTDPDPVVKGTDPDPSIVKQI